MEPPIRQLPLLLAYAERTWPPASALDRAATALAAALRARATQGRARRLGAIVEAVESLAPDLRALTDDALRRAAQRGGIALRIAQGDGRVASADRVASVLAPVAEAAARVLGQRPFGPQLTAAHGCVQGMLVEMATGEGKTLAASLAAATIALSGTPVHHLTVNRYLAERDAAFAGPLHRFLGLDCGLVTDATPPEARGAAYRCAITIAVNKDIAFDYMRDRVALGRALADSRRKAASLGGGGRPVARLRGLHHAIIDEADSVLIDEARTPLILAVASGSPGDPSLFDTALGLTDALTLGTDFVMLEDERRCILLPPGREALAAHFGTAASPPWDVAGEREHLVEQALAARFMLLSGEHYLIRDGKALIIDEFTGRVLPDRTWSDGLQELVERKEGLDLSPRHDTQARMTFQRFARRYRKLSGLSGTLDEVAGELWRVYGVRVAKIPTRLPDRKAVAPFAGHIDRHAKWQAIGDRVAAWHGAGVPVLIGTRTLTASQEAAAMLTARGLPHVVLNAAQDRDEAAIVARAGQSATITVATNMAGRGTDIHVDADVAAEGGLRVVVSEPHEARRIDRQLIGRCGRQGQPGEARLHVALDDALLMRHGTGLERLVARFFLTPTLGRSAAWLARRAQRRSERLHAGMRRDLLRADAWIEDAIAFAGDPE